MVLAAFVTHNRTMDLELLKRETALDHDRAEKSMRVMEPELGRSGYIDTLRSLYGFIRGWEIWAEGVTRGELREQLHARQRSALLAADLRFFSSQLPEDLYPGPSLTARNTAEVLGTMYVIEGSTLGGQYIARHVEKVLSLAPGHGDTYFQGYGERSGQMWQEMRELLRGVPDQYADTVIFAAKLLFSDFANWNVRFGVTTFQGQ